MAEFPNKNIDYGWQWPFRYWPASLNERKRTLLPFKLTLGNLQTKKHASSSWKCTWSRIAKCVNWVVELGFLKIEFTIHIHSPHSSLVDYLAQVIYAKTVPPLFIAFSNWYGFLCSPRIVSGCVSLAPRKHFFHKGPPFEFIYIPFLQKRGPLWKKVFSGAKETHPDILRGGHRNPYQLENSTKICLHICITWTK